MSELDRAAEWLERVFRVPSSRDLVPGVGRVVAASEPSGRGPYAACRLRVVFEAEGVESDEVELECAVRRTRWPAIGDRIPARVDRAEPSQSELRWEE